MKAIITVTGKDKVGIISLVSSACSENNVNIVDISQTVMKEFFAMTMLVEIDGLACGFADFASKMQKLGVENGVDIRVMHEDIFNSMHRI